MHTFADGATRPLKSDISPTVYLALITRHGNDHLREDLQEQLGISDKRPPRKEDDSPNATKSEKN
jgi:hypothetical protein